MVGVVVVVWVINVLLGYANELAVPMLAQIDPVVAIIFAIVVQIFGWIVQIFLGIGQAKVFLQLARTGRSEFGVLFSGGDRLLPVLGYSILAGILMVFGFLLLIVPGILMLLFFWGSYFQVVEGRSTVMQSFSDAYQYGKLNAGTTFVIWLASIAIILLGFLALCIGLLFAAPLVSMLWIVAYLMMSGQISGKR